MDEIVGPNLYKERILVLDCDNCHTVTSLEIIASFTVFGMHIDPHNRDYNKQTRKCNLEQFQYILYTQI